MRVVQLQHGHNQPTTSEFTSVNHDRVANNISLEFYLAVCRCGSVGLYLVEAGTERAYWKDGIDSTVTSTYERIELDCPSGCGGHLTLAFNEVHPHHGIKVRCLEAWTHRVEVRGLEDDLDPERRNYKTHGISVFHHPEHDHIDVDIHLHIPYAKARGADGRMVIMDEVNRKLRDIPYSKDFLR